MKEHQIKEIRAKRIMFAAPGSHSGKTTVTCGFLEVLKRRGLEPVSFKCGPDYIDPMFHESVLKVPCRNLDTYFAGTEGVRDILAGCGDRYAVVEGAMGIYDGARLDDLTGSAYEIAEATKTPIVLVVDGSGMGRTLLSLIRGVLADDTAHLIRGILLNKISEGYYRSLEPVLKQALEELRTGVRLLGCLPKQKEITIESRHLGLKLPGEMEDLYRKTKAAGELLLKCVDIDQLLRIMEETPVLHRDETQVLHRETEPVQNDVPGLKEEDPAFGTGLTLAVARDDAFCFYYRENLELFERYGVRLQYFSPLRDREVPPEADGILLGGGYPELYLKELSENTSMLHSVRSRIAAGTPSLAECGGFMYLHKIIIDAEGVSYPMAGILEGECRFTGHLVRFGYMRLREIHDAGIASDEMYRSLVGMKGHEFHYYDSTVCGDAYVAEKPYKPAEWTCINAGTAGTAGGSGIWGFPHLYYGSKPEFVRNFIHRMREVSDGTVT